MAKYPTLSKTLDKSQYTTYRDQKVMFNGRVVTVAITTLTNQYGSWERGFKWSDRKIGVLERRAYTLYPYQNRRAKWWQTMMRSRRGYVPAGRYVAEYSADHGKTWHTDRAQALKCQGKTVIERTMRQEMAFDSIQKICREYDGPGYKWRP